MASDNRLWGAERIRGELLKLDIRVCKRTIQKYMRCVRPPRSRGQNWRTFLRNHTGEIWACDFLQVTDLFFRSLFAFFIIELKSRKVMHVGVTRAPTDAWTAQQLREATPYVFVNDIGDQFLIRIGARDPFERVTANQIWGPVDNEKREPPDFLLTKKGATSFPIRRIQVRLAPTESPKRFPNRCFP
jgi:hypothetical protein